MQMTLVSVQTVLLAAIMGYASAWLFYVLSRPRIATMLYAAAWGLNTAIFLANWVASGHPPFGNMYHVMVALALCFLPLSAILAAKEGLTWLRPYFALAAVFPLAGALAMNSDLPWQRVPALQSGWFVPHVLAYTLGYALCAVGFILLVTSLFRRAALHRDEWQQHGDAALQTVRLAFPFLTFGLFSGALWAEEAWGAYWSWDPKETWSLITWALYALYLHLQFHTRLRRVGEATHALAFLALLATFLLVNLIPKLSSALHSYAAN